MPADVLTTPAAETRCCAPFSPHTWDRRELRFHGKLFVKARVRSKHYVPQDMAEVFARTWSAIDAAGAAPTGDRMVLSEDATPEQSHHFFAVTRPVPGCEMATLTGVFRTHVVDAPFADLPNQLAAYRGELTMNGFNPNQIYAWFTTCPKCAAAYGENQIVLVAAKIGSRVEPA